MTETILLQVFGVMLFSTDLTPQAWILVGLVILGVGAIVAWLIGRAALIWVRLLKEVFK